jgi:adenine-specific DNA-methyltransferase
MSGKRMLMSIFDIAFEKIGILVQDFRRNESHYKSTSYTEAQARKDFIDKFWIALGWDVNHDRETNPYEQEVKVERGVAMGGGQRRADYAFYLAPNFRDVRFFVEAKKPFVDIGTKESYFQLIRYGWNSETPLAALTDFEQFHVLDCRWRPDLETALNRSISKFHYTDYAVPDKFSEIYWLFSREAVAAGSLEKRAAELPKPRGKAVQYGLFPGGYQSIDESFLSELDEYRNSLAHSFKNHNPDLNSETLTELAQRTLDRLVFLRFLEDKGIEPVRIIEHFGGKGTAWEDFIAASRRLDGIYNGIVYKRHDILDGPDLRVDENAFADICESLSHLNSPYDFNAIPIHILGSIYERFLGKVIVATDKRAKVEEKPEVRKAGGVYYTPEYIVRYIVENTVGKLIAGKTPREIADMRFADIACGSGSFLLGVFDLLLAYHGHYYNDNPGKAKKGDCVRRDGTLYLSLQKKREILLNNIYGVDIDAQAVEVCQLSLYLKLLQEETESSAHQFLLDFEHEARMKRLLPDLGKNIRCGNSLIGTDILDGQLFPNDEERKLNPMNFEDAFPEVMKRGGFDAIVGNPPYVLLQGEFRDNTQLDYFRTNYSVASYKVDTYHLFIERGIRFTMPGGRCAMITPANFLTNNYLAVLRRFMLERSAIDHILVADGGVFHGISVDNAIFVVKAGEATQNAFPIIHSTPEASGLREESQILITPTEALKQAQVLFTGQSDGKQSVLWERSQQASVQLKAVAFVNFGKQLRDRKKFTHDVIEIGGLQQIPKDYRPCYTGRDISRYGITWGKLACLDSEVARQGGCWDTTRQNAKNKLVTRQIGIYPKFGLDPHGYQCLNTVFMVNVFADGYDPRFLLGVLNSKLIQRLWTERFYDQRRTFPKIKGTYLEQLPICRINFSDPTDKKRHDEMVAKVEAMLTAKKQLAQAKTDKDKTYYENKCVSLDRQIDRLVYDLYGLTEEEIKIVEGSNSDS